MLWTGGRERWTGGSWKLAPSKFDLKSNKSFALFSLARIFYLQYYKNIAVFSLAPSPYFLMFVPLSLYRHCSLTTLFFFSKLLIATIRDSHFRPDSDMTADMGFVSSPVKVFVLNIKWTESMVKRIIQRKHLNNLILFTILPLFPRK